MPSPSCVSPPPTYQLLNVWTNPYETWYVYHATWAHINGVLHKSLSWVCMSVCLSLPPLLGSGSVKTFPQQRIYATVEELLDASFSMRSCPIEGEAIHLSFLRNNLVKTFQWQERIVGGIVFYVVHVVSKENKRLVLPRTYCYRIYCI
jgi:hypothetical protein